jgi:hypothetical protein
MRGWVVEVDRKVRIGTEWKKIRGTVKREAGRTDGRTGANGSYNAHHGRIRKTCGWVGFVRALFVCVPMRVRRCVALRWGRRYAGRVERRGECVRRMRMKRDETR